MPSIFSFRVRNYDIIKPKVLRISKSLGLGNRLFATRHEVPKAPFFCHLASSDHKVWEIVTPDLLSLFSKSLDFKYLWDNLKITHQCLIFEYIIQARVCRGYFEPFE